MKTILPLGFLLCVITQVALAQNVQMNLFGATVKVGDKKADVMTALITNKCQLDKANTDDQFYIKKGGSIIGFVQFGNDILLYARKDTKKTASPDLTKVLYETFSQENNKDAIVKTPLPDQVELWFSGIYQPTKKDTYKINKVITITANVDPQRKFTLVKEELLPNNFQRPVY